MIALTKNQCELLISMVNASIKQAVESGIPIAQECYKDIDEIKKKLYHELQEISKGGNKF